MTLKDADKLIELIDDDIASLDKNMPTEGYYVCLCTLQMAKLYILALPTIDAEPVVRCKDCKLRGVPEKCVAYEAFWDLGDDGFCNFGERKDDGENG